MTLAAAAIEAGQLDDALEQIETVINDPRLVDYLRGEHVLLARARDPNRLSLIGILHIVSRKCCAVGRFNEGRLVARRALDLAMAVGQPTGEPRYSLARAYVAPGDRAPEKSSSRDAANHLYLAFVAHPRFKDRYIHDPAFDSARAQIDELLKQKKLDPIEEYRRRLAAKNSSHGR
jgi:hypothetical protein